MTQHVWNLYCPVLVLGSQTVNCFVSQSVILSTFPYSGLPLGVCVVSYFFISPAVPYLCMKMCIPIFFCCSLTDCYYFVLNYIMIVINDIWPQFDI